MKWCIGNGCSVKFWLDPWISERWMIFASLRQIQEEEKDKLVVDYWLAGTGWNWEEIGDYFLADLLVQIAAVAVNEENSEPNELGWQATVDG